MVGKYYPKIIVCAAVLLLINGCAGPSFRYKKNLYKTLAVADYEQTAQIINKNKKKQYGKKNALLYYLDLGLAYHSAKNYKESEKHFSEAEKLYDELQTKSISRAAKTFLINDAATEYHSPEYEKTLLHIFRSLNYAYQDDMVNALVEVRKLSAFLTRLRDAKGHKSNTYKDDGFAQYLGSLMYDDYGRPSDARISLEDAQNAYKWYSSYYGVNKPVFEQPINLTRQNGELVFIHYNGVMPAKISKTFQVAWGRALAAVKDTHSSHPREDVEQFNNALRAGLLGKAITVSYPEFEKNEITVTSSEISIIGKNSQTQVMENIAEIARKHLKSKTAGQRLRMIARAAIKYVLSQKITRSMDDKHGRTAGILAGIITSAIAAGTETADTRSWNTLPSEIRMARVTLPEGVYDARLTFKNKFGRVIDTIILRDIEIKKGKRTYIGHQTSY